MKAIAKLSEGMPAGATPELIPSWESCPAKSNPAKTVRQHALESGATFMALRRLLGFPESLLPSGCLLFAMGHDCGKLSPVFIGDIDPPLAKKCGMKCFQKIRHEVISESSLREFLKVREDRAEAIVGWHHGRHNEDVEPPGSLNYGGDGWKVQRDAFLRWTAEYAEPLPKVLSVESQLLTAGLVCLADWIASDENNFIGNTSDRPFEDIIAEAENILAGIGFKRPEFKRNLRFEDIFPPFQPNQAQIELAASLSGPGVYLLENTMGSGKTEAALYAAYKQISSGANSGIFFALPTRLTSNKIHERVNTFLEKVSVASRARLVHGTAWLEAAGGNELAPGGAWFAPSKRALLEPFGVGTIDQALKGVLNVKHFFVRLAGLAGKVVIIDEVHAFDDYMHYLLVNLCRILVRLRCTVILLSATLPASRRSQLLESPSSGAEPYPRISVNRGGGASVISLHSMTKKRISVISICPSEATRRAVEAARRGSNVALIANTVADAGMYFRQVRSELERGSQPVGLLHSRFPQWRRAEIEGSWLEALGNKFPEKRPRGSILISTQIIEQSVDMDFDLMISEPAPSDLLFQRMGRLWRHEREHRPLPGPEFYRIDHALSSGSTPKECEQLVGKNGKVYPVFLLYRMELIWKNIKEIVLPDDMQSILENNYRPPADDGTEIERALYEKMMLNVREMINAARTAAQPNLTTCLAAAADDGEYAPTRLSDYPQRELLLLRDFKICGGDCELKLSDNRELRLWKNGGFVLENMKIMAANTVKVPAYWFSQPTDALPESLKIYWRSDQPVPALVGLDGRLSLADGTAIPMSYNNDEGIFFSQPDNAKGEDETLFFDW